ncbi:MAG: hypothetical protein JWN86_4394 [Planctomycetota bacterium]|nr:hypothetical protein [Planctomycetota bacterium]
MDEPRSPGRSRLAHGDLRIALDHLDRALAGPLIAMKDGLAWLLAAEGESQDGHVQTLVAICEDTLSRMGAELRDLERAGDTPGAARSSPERRPRSSA